MIRAALAVVALFLAIPTGAQTAPEFRPEFTVSLSLEGWLPVDPDGDPVAPYALGGGAEVSFAPVPFAVVTARAGVHSLQLESGEAAPYVGGAIGLGYRARLSDRLSAGVTGFGGLGRLFFRDANYGLFELSARVEGRARLTAGLSLGISAGYTHLATPNTGLLDALTAGIRLVVSPAELARSRGSLSIERIDTQAVFPVLRSWYDSEPLGTVTLRNGEDGPVESVRVWFHVPEYMGGPRLGIVLPRIDRGAVAVVPLHAVFDERILGLTENTTTVGSVSVEYSFLGTNRTVSEPVELVLHHRNAMTWEDDRRAAAFVSPTDPAALWLARHASSIVRDRLRGDLPPNLQVAIGVFESLRLYGVNYVVDPNSAYVDMAGDSSVIDYLQYPSQTLAFRGGDCDDLSILFCSLLESAGINTAFITIPGHIYMAFDLGLPEALAREQFFDPGLLLFHDGRAWAPVEITMVRDGFVKAWRVGAKQWIDGVAAGVAEFLPMRESWAYYQPSGLQGASPRFDLPDERILMAAFDSAVDRFVVRELEPVIVEYERRLTLRQTPEVLNDYGITLARAGLLDAAWGRLAEAAQHDYPWAWNNLASVAFIRREYDLAHSYYGWAASLLPDDPIAVLGMARAAYELDRYDESNAHYERLVEQDPALAGRFGYLASVYGGPGRAWSMADRLQGTAWSRPAPVEPVASQPAPAVPEPAPTPVAIAEPQAEPEPEPAVAPRAAAAVSPPTVAEPAPEPPAEPEPPAAPQPAPAVPEPVPAPVAVAEPQAAPEPEPVVTPVTVAAAAEPAPEPQPSPAPTVVRPAIAARAPEDRDTTPAALPVAEPAPEPVAAPPPEPEPEPVVAVAPSEPTPTPVAAPPPEPEPVVAIEPPEPVPAAPPTAPYVDLLDPSVRARGGAWVLEPRFAAMVDPRATHAKLIVTPQPSADPAVYEFTARSLGTGRVGYGLHIHGRGAWDLSYYGGGDSILIWITSDRAAFGDRSPRLQVYRSRDEVNMTLLTSVRIPGSVYEEQRYRIEYDPAAGRVSVDVEGVRRLDLADLGNPPDFDFAALRALDRAEFADFRILRPLPAASPEGSHE